MAFESSIDSRALFAWARLLGINSVRQQLAEASSWADMVGIRIAEIEHRAAGLRAELDRAHVDADRLCVESAKIHKQAGAELDAAWSTLVTLQAQAEATEQDHAEQRKQAMKDFQAAAAVRERAAGLNGQLLAALKVPAESKPRKS